MGSLITDYLLPSSYLLAYTYCHDIDIHKFLLPLSYLSFLLYLHHTNHAVVQYILRIYSLGLVTPMSINGYPSYFLDLPNIIGKFYKIFPMISIILGVNKLDGNVLILGIRC